MNNILGNPETINNANLIHIYDHKFGEYFAAKTITDEIHSFYPELAKRFIHEANIWTNLDAHQNVTQLRFIKMIDGQPFLFLEYISGGDLSGWIKNRRLANDLPQVLAFAIQFCDGMNHILSKGINAHRDIKPKNCLITKDKILKVTDFGIAKVYNELPSAPVEISKQVQQELWHRTIPDRRSGERRNKGANLGQAHVALIDRSRLSCSRTGFGTPEYMAPEQFDDAKNVDVQADIYSFGVMLYEMITGRLPFYEDTWDQYHQAQQDRTVPDFDSGNQILNKIITICLAKKPSERFRDFLELRQGLARIYFELTQTDITPLMGIDLQAWEWISKSDSLAALGRYREALQCCGQALKLEPDNIAAFSNQAYVYGLMAQPAEALRCSEQALQIDPQFAPAWTNKGFALAAVEQYEQAIECFNQSIKIDAKQTDAWFDKGDCLIHLHRLEEALYCYYQALMIDPNDVDILFNQGMVLAELGRHREAVACFDRISQVKPRFANAWSYYGASLLELGQKKSALKCFQTALQLDQMNEIARKGIALCLGKGDIARN